MLPPAGHRLLDADEPPGARPEPHPARRPRERGVAPRALRRRVMPAPPCSPRRRPPGAWSCTCARDPASTPASPAATHGRRGLSRDMVYNLAHLLLDGGAWWPRLQRLAVCQPRPASFDGRPCNYVSDLLVLLCGGLARRADPGRLRHLTLDLSGNRFTAPWLEPLIPVIAAHVGLRSLILGVRQDPVPAGAFAGTTTSSGPCAGSASSGNSRTSARSAGRPCSAWSWTCAESWASP